MLGYKFAECAESFRSNPPGMTVFLGAQRDSMSAREADQIQALLTRLMEALRANDTSTAEIARAEREFFHANPSALRDDPAAPFRFQEWYLLERESEVLGAVPLTCLAMKDEERESLSDSLFGAFQVTGATAAEYTIRDLQGDTIHDLERIEELELEAGDLLVGRLFVGSLDVFVPSVALCRQGDSGALAAAFRKDVASLGIDRRLTQAEIEHLLFRGRGTGESESLPDDVPLERLEADLEACLHRGGVEDAPATAISSALKKAPRPGVVTGPLLEKIAFDTNADIEAVQRLMLSIWNHHQRHPSQSRSVPPMSMEASATSDVAPRPAPVNDDLELGAEVARRIKEGVDNEEDMADVFADIERMADMDPDPVGFRPDTVDLGAEPPAEFATGSDESSVGDEESSGDLRPLIIEYLWETGNDALDIPVLEDLVRTQGEASVPKLYLEATTSTDLLRLLLRKYLESAPGERAAAVGSTFAVIERFYGWVERTQMYELSTTLQAVRVGLVDDVTRLEAASLELSAAARGAVAASARDLSRVVHVTPEWIEVAPDDGDDLVRVAIQGSESQNLRPDDLLLGRLQVDGATNGSFAGMVIALPGAVLNLLG